VGAKAVAKVAIVCGNFTLQEYSGDYLLAAAQRDFTTDELAKFYYDIGHVPEIVDPASADGRDNVYPSAMYMGDDGLTVPEPSIRGRVLTIPLNAFFCLRTEQAFPVCALQYNILEVHVTFRPIRELFMVRDVFDVENNFPYIAPRVNDEFMQMHRFLAPPPDLELGRYSYAPNARDDWNADVYLSCDMYFLSNRERLAFTANSHTYLIKQVREQRFMDVVGSNRLEVTALGVAAGWLWYFQRSDANLRNEWSNYTNWPYLDILPGNVVQAPTEGDWPVVRTVNGQPTTVYIGPGVNPDGTLTGFMVQPPTNPQNQKNILTFMGILFDGSYRENVLPATYYGRIQQYRRCPGNCPEGLFVYSFGGNTDNASLQPTGSVCLSEYSKVVLELSTIYPPLDPLAQSMAVCDPQTNAVIATNKPSWRIYEYSFNMAFFCELWNFVIVENGNAGLKWAT
jgi:hypothetical protein